MAAPPRTGETEPVTATHTAATFGDVLRTWRQRRRLSQLDLAIEADVSARHLSFMETGRSAPSRAMVLRLAEVLDVPLRERNHLLTAAGLAPVYPERGLDHPEMAAVREGVQRVLAAYDPYPCVAVDRHWNILSANAATAVLLDGVAASLLERPNALRLTLHPDGLAPRIKNLGQWRHHLIDRLRREVAASGSGELAALLAELETYPGPSATSPDPAAVAVPLELGTDSGDMLTFISTVTTFGTALDLTAAELSIEAFLPADAATAAALVCRSASQGSPQ
ncbi:helix-turn-helix transcriptional regulator [Mycobacterium sp. IS-1496]|uniref:helix-turn-helix domain-containing protein n=1 Tax=Mycobacterium sp. IS-1496 TaxID=1772284 RepID=UPI0009E8A625|nr:helix-turn-helix transcriptional regulator [Mycobacterium sp. IS-1496]